MNLTVPHHRPRRPRLRLRRPSCNFGSIELARSISAILSDRAAAARITGSSCPSFAFRFNFSSPSLATRYAQLKNTRSVLFGSSAAIGSTSTNWHGTFGTKSPGWGKQPSPDGWNGASRLLAGVAGGMKGRKWSLDSPGHSGN